MFNSKKIKELEKRIFALENWRWSQNMGMVEAVAPANGLAKGTLVRLSRAKKAEKPKRKYVRSGTYA